MIGKIIKFMRKEKGLTQKDIYKIINIGQSTLSDYENGKITIDFETIEKIAYLCDYEVIFRNKKTKEEINSKNINRKI